jgi:hypothetical protein
LGSIHTPRLGNIAEAWRRLVDEQVVEVLEQWRLHFSRSDVEYAYSQQGECWYRYSVDQPDHGQIYPYTTNAFEGEGGTPLDEAVAEGLELGLILPEQMDDDSRTDVWRSRPH